MSSTSRQAVWRGVAAVVLPALFLVALAWGAVIALIHREFADAVRDAQRQNANLALAFEEHSLSTIRSVDQILQLGVLQHKKGEKIDPSSLARGARADDELVTSVAITDATGQVIASSGTVGRVSFSDRDFFMHHRDHDDGALFVSPPVEGRLTGRTVIPMSRRIDRPDGGFAGVIATGVDPGYFGEFYGKMELGRDGMVQLVGLDGATRARRTGALKAARNKVDRHSTLLTQQAHADSGNFVSEGRLEGVRRYTSYRTLREFGLVVAVGISEEDVLAGYIERRNGYLGAAALFSMLVALFAAFALKSMQRRRQFLDGTLRSEAQSRATFDQAAVGVAHVGLDGGFLKVNDTLCRLAGYSNAELLGRRFADLNYPQDRAAAEDAKTALIERGSADPVEGRYLRKDGSTLWAAVAPALVRDPQGRPDYFVAIVQDIGERKAAQEKVLHQAQFDLLTNLPNRALFADRFAQALRQARRQQWNACVMFIDLDRFKSVNDALGHAAGDTLLREVARRLSGSIRAADTAARIGGDEFAVLLAQVGKPQHAGLVADKILKALAAPMLLDGHEYIVTASIGIALFPEHGEDEEELVRSADAAMFEAKHAGRNGFRIYRAPPAAHAA